MVRKLIEEIKSIDKTLLEKINVRTSVRILRRKLKRAREIVDQVQLLAENEKDKDTAEDILLNISRLVEFREKSKICSLRAAAYAIVLVNKFKTKMTEFDMKQATSIVQTYDGSDENLAAFIDAAKLLNELTPDRHKGLALKFIRTRLTGKARLGLPDNIASIEALLDNVKSRCESKLTSEIVLAQLKAIKERETDKICDRVNDLTAKLSSVYLAEKLPVETATKMATKAGVETLKTKVTNSDLKLILKAGSFQTIQDAIQKVRENINNESPPQVLSFRAGRGRRFNGQRNQPPRYQQNTWRRGGGAPRGFNSQRGRGGYQNNNNNNNSGFRQNDNFQPRFQRRGNIYFATGVGNPQILQPGGAGGQPIQVHQNQQIPPQGQVALAQMLQRQ